MRSELGNLRPLFDDIRIKRKQGQAVREKAEKATKAEQRAGARLEQLKDRDPTGIETAKAQQEFDQAVRQKGIDTTACEEREAQLVMEEKEYKRGVFLCILNTLEQYVNARSSACTNALSIADQIANLGDSFDFYEDPGVDLLRGQLQALRSEPIE
jgi:hypothetical protein